MYDAISLYSGAGGIDDGLWQTKKIKVKVAIDIEPDMCETIRLNHPDTEVICGKVSDYIDSLPKTNIVAGGPPCPAFFRANMQRSFDMCEVNNFWAVVEKIYPKFYLMENVQDVKKKLIKHSHLVNCADYGVPQIRLRRFFTNLPLPKPTHSQKPNQRLDGVTPKPWVTIRKALKIDSILNNTKLWSINDPKFQNCSYQQRRYFHELDKPARTITTKDLGIQASMMLSDGTHCRKLTNGELATLQGFRKDYQFYGGVTSVKKQIGNAVPPPVIKAFFDHI